MPIRNRHHPPSGIHPWYSEPTAERQPSPNSWRGADEAAEHLDRLDAQEAKQREQDAWTRNGHRSRRPTLHVGPSAPIRSFWACQEGTFVLPGRRRKTLMTRLRFRLPFG